MGKLQKFDIIFDNPSAVYFAGQVISGRVIIILSASMEMKGVSITFTGQANVRWSERRTNHRSGQGHMGNHSRTVHYSASESYFQHIIPLKGHGRKETLPPGEHFLPFAFTLPIGIPSSFEGSHGYVRYFCKANIDRPWKFDSVCKMPFTVNSLFDLNQQATSRQSATNQAHKSICCCCCKSGPVSVVATIDRMGYVPGESVSVNAEVENLTKRAMNNTKVVLRAAITYRATTKSKVEIKDIAEVKRGRVEPGQSEIWSVVPIRIPPVPPSNLHGCNIIDIQYRIDFIVDPSGPAFDLVVSLPLLIGTIPLQNYFSNFQAPPTYNSVTSYNPLTPSMQQPYPAGPTMVEPYPVGPTMVQPYPAGPTMVEPYPAGPTMVQPYPAGPTMAQTYPSAPSMPQPYPDAPPPSYAESVFGQVDIRDNDDNEYTHGKLNYAPVYTYYNVTPSAPYQ